MLWRSSRLTECPSLLARGTYCPPNVQALPYLVGNVVELLDAPEEVGALGTLSHAARVYTTCSRVERAALTHTLSDLKPVCPRGTRAQPYTRTSTPIHLSSPVQDQEEEASGAAMDLDDLRKNKSCVIKTTTRQTVYLPIPGLVDTADLKPNDLIGTNKDSYLILEKLPTEYDPRVKAMEVDEKPTEEYSDVGGCDKQIQVSDVTGVGAFIHAVFIHAVDVT